MQQQPTLLIGDASVRQPGPMLATPPLFNTNPAPSNEKKGWNSLYISLMNASVGTIVNILLDSTAEDTLYMTAQLMDFQKTQNINLYFSVAETITTGAILVQRDNRAYTLIFPSDHQKPDSFSQANAFYNVQFSVFEDNLFYACSGLAVNSHGSNVDFWGQTDAVSREMYFSVLLLGSYLTEKRMAIFDLCAKRVEKMKRLCGDQGKGITMGARASRPLFIIGDFSLFNNLIVDCDVTCKPKYDSMGKKTSTNF